MSGVLSTIYTDVEGADRTPTTAQRAVQAEYDARLDALLQRWQVLREGDLKNVDAQLVAAGKPFTIMPYPNRSHGIFEGPGTTKHLFSLLTRYLHEHVPAGGR